MIIGLAYDGKLNSKTDPFYSMYAQKAENAANLLGVGWFRVRSRSCVGCDLSYVFESNKFFQDYDISISPLTDADLQGVDLSEANLEGSDLSGANLTGASLLSARMKRTNLTNATLLNADLNNAVLTDSIFCNTTMPDGTINNSGC